ncbi:PH domain-containing protein [Paraliobacillus sp. JSM ZJ581]|uniref:PH domain-containing protein n=1 Tax=Paraliobacillus sp. JSM ZJ581 TaxID=3342118 RepID=UPI0035A94D15
MSKPKRLHPISVIFTTVQTFRKNILGLLPIAILAIGDGMFFYLVLGIAVLFLLIIGFSVLTWMRYTYQVEEDQLRIEHGVFIRKKRTISKHRIQSIDLSQNIIHRLFGLTKVQIETAGSDQEIDAALHAVTIQEGKQLHDQLKYKKEVEIQHTGDIVEKVNDPSRQVKITELLIAGSTSASFGFIIGLIALGFSELEVIIPDSFYNQASAWVVNLTMEAIIVMALIFFIIVWGLGILVTLLQYWDFTITRYEKELFITRGLLEKKQMTIPLKRIQAVGIKETVVRQLFGFSTVYVEIASGELNTNGDMKTLLFPLMKRKEINAFLAEILPEYHLPTEKNVKLPKRALPYYLIRTAIIPLIGLIVVAFLAMDWIVVALVFFALAIVLGYFQYRSTRYQLSDNQLMIQTRVVNNDILLLKHRRLQSFAVKQHFIHHRHNLASIDTAILSKLAGRHIILKELEVESALQLADWYSYKK